MPPKGFGQGNDKHNIHAYLERHGALASMLEQYSLKVTEDGRLMVVDPTKEYCPPDSNVAPSKDHPLVLK